MIPGTGKTRAQFADEYKTAQENIGSNYDQLDTVLQVVQHLVV